MPEVICSCGKTFHAARANARYCSDKCRKRTKRSGADVVDLPKPDTETELEQTFGPIETATRRELAEVDRVETVAGQQAIAAARKLDRGYMETGSAFASLSKELSALMDRATKGAGKATAPQTLKDELAARRERQGA